MSSSKWLESASKLLVHEHKVTSELYRNSVMLGCVLNYELMYCQKGFRLRFCIMLF